MLPSPEPAALKDSFCLVLGRAARLWRREANEALNTYSLSEATTTPLWNISRLGDGIHQRTLAENLGIESQSLVRLLDHLEAAELVSRRNDPTDRRAKALYLTEAGHSMVTKVNEVLDNMRTRLFSGISDGELAITSQVLNSITASAEQGVAETMLPSPEPAVLKDSFCLVLGRAARLWRREANEALNTYSLSEATTTPLWNISRLGDGIHQRTLAENLGIESQSLVRLLDHLEAAELVSRRNDPTDRRAKALYLTEAGHSMVTKVNEVLDNMRTRLFSGISDEDLAITSQVLNKITISAEQRTV